MGEYGLQLYSVKSFVEADYADALEKVAGQGYKFVEPAGFFGKTAEEFNALLIKNGLTLSGTHSDWTALRDNYEETLAFHKAIKNPRYIIPWAGLDTAEKIENFCNFVNEVQPKLAAEGISLQYHNHSGEFLPNKDGLIPEDELAARTNIMFEIDTYWAYRAGRDPIAVMESLKGRIDCIHVKDGTMEKGLPLGMGTAPVKAVYEYAVKNGLTMVVENEPDKDSTLPFDAMGGAKVCIDYLKSLE